MMETTYKLGVRPDKAPDKMQRGSEWWLDGKATQYAKCREDYRSNKSPIEVWLVLVDECWLWVATVEDSGIFSCTNTAELEVNLDNCFDVSPAFPN